MAQHAAAPNSGVNQSITVTMSAFRGGLPCRVLWRKSVLSCFESIPLARRVLSMRPLKTVQAEPRDFLDSPSYRVNFWQRSSPEHAWNLDAYALTEVEDIPEVLRWVDEHADGRRFEVFVEMDEEPARSFQSPRRTGLIRLLGSNPKTGETVEKVRFVKISFWRWRCLTPAGRSPYGQLAQRIDLRNHASTRPVGVPVTGPCAMRAVGARSARQRGAVSR